MSNSFQEAFAGKTVLVTGHTGFKGTWLTLWLNKLQANVVGYSLDPPTTPNAFGLTNACKGVTDIRADVRDISQLSAAFEQFRPDVVLHLAAQPLVRLSYREPLETLATNVMGTANVLECARHLNHKCAIVVVTSDKCYENLNTKFGYRETDRVGGHDPYSMSKGAAELVVASWRNSFFGTSSPIRVATARAGNVVGGGDWAEDRITTDCINALCNKRPIGIRNPHATRPWQHVLEPLSGYLQLAAVLMEADGDSFCGAWNFGPSVQSVCTVENYVRLLINAWGSGELEVAREASAPHEATLLSLSCEKAYHDLAWQATWELEECIKHTADWYKHWHNSSADLRDFSLAQIEMFEDDSQDKSQPCKF
jgi:CDP-glucose 4,6-dehydratase